MTSDPLPSINLEFLPDWARQPAQLPRHFEDHDERPARREDRPRGPGPRGRSDLGRERRDAGGARRESRPPARGGRGRREEARAPVRSVLPSSPRPSVQVAFLPEPRALELVTQQLQATGRAYPLFSLAAMFLEKPERHHLRLQSRPLSKEAAPSLLFQCSICHAVTPDRGETIKHILGKHRDLFYKEEREASEAPKGNFACVAQCKLNGEILGPPNHHAYSANLMRLYRKNFSHMDFERFKGSVASIHDPEAVKKWKAEASFKITFKALQDPEARPLASDAEVQQHFHKTHAAAALREGTTFTIEGLAARQAGHAGLAAVIREAWENEGRFPINLAGHLREKFIRAGLQIFKGRQGMQFVCTARPKPLTADEKVLSPGIRAIVNHLKAHPGCNRKQLIKALAPRAEPAAVPAAPSSPTETAAGAALLQDLHWLVREGYLVEYHTGLLELTKKPGGHGHPPRRAGASRASAPSAAAAGRPPVAPTQTGETARISPPPENAPDPAVGTLAKQGEASAPFEKH